MLLLLLRTQVPILDLENRKYLGMVSALDLAAYVARYVRARPSRSPLPNDTLCERVALVSAYPPPACSPPPRRSPSSFPTLNSRASSVRPPARRR